MTDRQKMYTFGIVALVGFVGLMFAVFNAHSLPLWALFNIPFIPSCYFFGYYLGKSWESEK